jgi:hypothetical protein
MLREGDMDSHHFEPMSAGAVNADYLTYVLVFVMIFGSMVTGVFAWGGVWPWGFVDPTLFM